MHRSRVGVFLIDHPEDRFDTALAFWAGAVGRSAEPPSDDDPYVELGMAGSVKLEAQRTGAGTPPRIHLDIETDDIAAEVSRLEQLGAAVIERPEGYVVMRDPGGMAFCVVRVQTGELFDAHATTWP